MSYDALLIHTVEVRRRDGRKDRFGQPVEPRADQFADAIYRGRLDVPSGGERYTERSRDVVIYSHLLFLEPGAEVHEADVVTVLDRGGRPLVTTADVVQVTQAEDFVGPHHLELKIQARKSGDPLDAE